MNSTLPSSWVPGISAEIAASDGTRLHYTTYGTGRCELLLLHGTGPSDVWRHLLPHFDLTTFRLVTCDFRGYGRSQGGAADYTYPKLHSDLLAIARAAGLHDFFVVGFSGGSRNAVWFAAENAARVRGLVLVAPIGFDVVPFPAETVTYAFDFLELNRTLPPEFDAWFSDKIGERHAPLIRSLADTPRAVLEASTRLWLYTPVADQAKRITQPVLVVMGKREPFYNLDFQQGTTLAALPRAKTTVLDCAHFTPCEEPAALAESIARFCLEQSTAQRPRG